MISTAVDTRTSWHKMIGIVIVRDSFRFSRWSSMISTAVDTLTSWHKIMRMIIVVI